MDANKNMRKDVHVLMCCGVFGCVNSWGASKKEKRIEAMLVKWYEELKK